ncbi:ABC transporter permease [Oceanirhabdus sp. W0125-5]|uniref:ABC transporter permease n=1 Tax=Oceanirhabdus sp. W0125-5 TaxID=2999116 RepID=UPI0022F32856|nr:ABC transporter permease [Oceanirhabdus sp. W0125-5]WBW97175.1 ABC transporter permease [Oceanirhabdus sp. W0125-5]
MLNIALVNLKKMLKDKKAIIGIFIAPIIIMFLFSFLSQAPNSVVNIGVTDNLKSEKSEYIINELRNDSTINITILNEQDLKKKLKDKKITLGILMSQENEEKFTLLKSDINSYILVKNKLNNILREIKVLGGIPKKTLTNRIEYINHYKSSGKIFVTGFLINFMMFSMIYMINELAELKKSNILKRSYTCPYSSFQLLGGKLLAMFALIFMQFLIVNTMGLLLFKELIFENIIVAISVFIPFILLILGVGLLVSRVFKNPDLSPVIVNLIVVPTGLISGTFMPKELMPEFLFKYSFIAPQHWVVKGLEHGNNLLKAFPSVLILAIMALCFLAASSYNFKNFLRE